MIQYFIMCIRWSPHLCQIYFMKCCNHELSTMLPNRVSELFMYVVLCFPCPSTVYAREPLVESQYYIISVSQWHHLWVSEAVAQTMNWTYFPAQKSLVLWFGKSIKVYQKILYNDFWTNLNMTFCETIMRAMIKLAFCDIYCLLNDSMTMYTRKV